MKPIVCVSSEGHDTKIVILSKEKDKIKVKKTFSMIMSGGENFSDPTETHSDSSLKGFESDFSIESIGDSGNKLATVDKSDVSFAANYFGQEELKNADFIPVVTDPVVNHHNFTGHINNNKKKNIEAIITDIAKQKNISIADDSIDYIKIDEQTLHSVFIREDNTSVNFINAWASHNGKKYYKIATVKNSETALAHYVAKSNKFFDEDYTLIINTGHESSKLIFLKGSKLTHIGTSLDIGTKDIHTYDVYFSKILLEMENGGIPRLDNVILCGEDNSENLVLSFYGTFPEANVTELAFEGLDLTGLSDEQKENLSSFAFPIAAGLEYFEEKDKKHQGINFLPKYIQENQKFIQFGWHSLLVLPLLFGATFFFTFEVLENNKTILEQQREITRLKELKIQNELILQEMDGLSSKIENFDRTQTMLDSATAGAEVWGGMLTKVSDFVERRRSFWVTSLETNLDKTVNLKGYALSRNVLTEFVDNSNSSLLNTVTYEPLRDTKTYSYTLEYKINSFGANKNEP
ncbi:MAG: hypothetical protein KDC88_09275 [Ignavibacteriae bacterium]|nr:hypothetical protein [Ignavibacteriota bacterium]MCB9207734.1 hypothetical protein [Ignavibacteriales bacterium]MCB9258504.1 hypothetical protein [Ignavibacteriales bacterium]